RFCLVCHWSLLVVTIFFFQAEDGIRDRNVTGVQTCALPILSALMPVARTCRMPPPEMVPANTWSPTVFSTGMDSPVIGASSRARSEERRVGKECRSRGWPCQYKKKYA